MSEKITRAMILSAGLGTRLLPITEKMPKPLVSLLNIPNILHTLFLLKRSGITDVILNLYHHPDLLKQYLGDGSRWDLRIEYSREENLLGTGGGVKKAESFFGEANFVLVNCDFISNVDLKPLMQKHQSKKALATMILFQDSLKQPFYSVVGIDTLGQLCSLPRMTTTPPFRTGIFTGIHFLNREALSFLEATPSGINEILYPALMKKFPHRVFGEFLEMGSTWNDTGDLSNFRKTTFALIDELSEKNSMTRDCLTVMGNYEEKKPGLWMPKGENNLPKVFKPPVVIGKGCTLGEGATVGPYVVIGDNSTIEKGVNLSRFIALEKSNVTRESGSQSDIQFEKTVIKLS